MALTAPIFGNLTLAVQFCFFEGKHIKFIVNATPDSKQQTAFGRVDGRGVQ